MNNIVLIGRLTRKPEIRYTQNQTAICKFDLAVDRPYGKEKATDFIRVVVFGKQAENCERFLDKGRQVAVQGSLQTSVYEKDGEKRTSYQVAADRVEFLGSGEKKADAPAGFMTMDDLDEDCPF